jgi:hypothetical protein
MRKAVTLRSKSINKNSVDESSIDASENEERMTRLTVDLPASMHRKLKILAMDSRCSMSDVIRSMLSRKL